MRTEQNRFNFRSNAIVKLLLISGLTLLILAGSLQVSTAVFADETMHMEEFDVVGQPLNLVVESTNQVWFTLPAENAIGSLVVTNTIDYEFTSYIVPTASSEPYDLVYDGAKTIWFTERVGNKIGRLNIETGEFNEYSIPTNDSQPTGIAIAPDGMIWFAQRSGNQLAMFNPNNQTFIERSFPQANIGAEDVVVQRRGCTSWATGSEGCIWTTGPNVNQVFAFTLETQQFFNVSTYNIFINQMIEEPWNIAIQGGNRLWISTRKGNRIARFEPGTVSLWRWFALPTANSQPTGIAINSTSTSSNIWFAGSESGRAGQLVLQSNGQLTTLREHPLPSADSQPNGIAVDAASQVWITDGANQKIVRWSSPYFFMVHMPSINNRVE
jgi:virginiamycin B lyase